MNTEDLNKQLLDLAVGNMQTAIAERYGNTPPAAAEQAQQAEPVARDWPKIDAAMRDYVEGYEMIGDNNEVCYSPTKAEQELIIDCMRGLLADAEFIGMLTTQPPAVAELQRKLEEAEHHRDCLARAIRNAAVKAGIIHADAVVEGPHLLMLADNLGEAAMKPAVAVPQEAADSIRSPFNACCNKETCRAMLAAAPQATAEDSSAVRGAAAMPDDHVLLPKEPSKATLRKLGMLQTEYLDDNCRRYTNAIGVETAEVLYRGLVGVLAAKQEGGAT